MVDTVTAKQEISRKHLGKFEKWHCDVTKDERGERYKKYRKQVRLTDFTSIEVFAEKRLDGAVVGFTGSLAKVGLDNNVALLQPSAIRDVAKQIDNLIGYYTDVEFDCLNAKLSRLDLAYNWKVTEDEVRRRIDAARLIRCYGRLHPQEVGLPDGVPSAVLGNKHRQWILYSKFAETSWLINRRNPLASDGHLRASVGELRYEYRQFARRLATESKRRNIPHMTLEVLSDPQYATEILTKEMRRLGLNTAVAGCDERRERLKEYCGNDHAKCGRLWLIQDWVDEYGEKETSDYFGYHRFYRARKELIAAGVWLAAENRKPLPALEPPKFETGRDEGLRSNTSTILAPVQTFIH